MIVDWARFRYANEVQVEVKAGDLLGEKCTRSVEGVQSVGITDTAECVGTRRVQDQSQGRVRPRGCVIEARDDRSVEQIGSRNPGQQPGGVLRVFPVAG